ncbi:MAG: hypothetical protein JSU07_06235 [Bacteroidetes bacterium]|nr:hypothetical protein [Bacteroidota bacterium]
MYKKTKQFDSIAQIYTGATQTLGIGLTPLFAPVSNKRFMLFGYANAINSPSGTTFDFQNPQSLIDVNTLNVESTNVLGKPFVDERYYYFSQKSIDSRYGYVYSALIVD